MKMKRIVQIVEAERKRRGWSQEEMAFHLGVSVTTYNRWILGKHDPSPLAEKRLESFINGLQPESEKEGTFIYKKG